MARELNSVPIRNPGILGQNTEQQGQLNDARWATELTNAVFDQAGRVAARKGYSLVTTSGGAGAFDTEAIFEYVVDDSTTEIISAADAKIYEGTTTLTAITGTITTPTANLWQFLNFNGKCVGVQAGHTPIVYTSGGSFANIVAASGSVPTGNCGLSAWGRLFITDSDEVTIKISASLDETHWTTGAATLDTTLVWPDGLDKVVALAAWANKLVIFGTRSVLIYKDADTIGTASDTFGIEDIVVKAGCKGRDGVQAIGDDLVYVSHDGLRALGRNLQFDTLPMTELTTQVKTELVSDIHAATDATIKSAYCEDDGCILLRLGANYWYFDVKQRLPETGDLRCSRWSGIPFKSIYDQTDVGVWLGFQDGISQYTGYLDDTSTYSLLYTSPWLDMESDQVKILKSAEMIITSQKPYQVVLKWFVDYSREGESVTAQLTDNRTASLWNDAEWSGDVLGNPVGLWSGGATIRGRIPYQMSAYGHRIKVGYQVTIDQASFAVEELRILLKVGKLAA